MGRGRQKKLPFLSPSLKRSSTRTRTRRLTAMQRRHATRPSRLTAIQRYATRPTRAIQFMIGPWRPQRRRMQSALAQILPKVSRRTCQWSPLHRRTPGRRRVHRHRERSHVQVFWPSLHSYGPKTGPVLARARPSIGSARPQASALRPRFLWPRGTARRHRRPWDRLLRTPEFLQYFGVPSPLPQFSARARS